MYLSNHAAPFPENGSSFGSIPPHPGYGPREALRLLASGRLFLAAVLCNVLELLLWLPELIPLVTQTPGLTSDILPSTIVAGDDPLAGMYPLLDIIDMGYRVGMMVLWLWGLLTAVGLLLIRRSARSAQPGSLIGTAGLSILKVQKVIELILSCLIAVGILVALVAMFSTDASIVLLTVAMTLMVGGVSVVLILPNLLAQRSLQAARDIFRDGQTDRRASMVLAVFYFLGGGGTLMCMPTVIWSALDVTETVLTLARDLSSALSMILFGLLLVKFRSRPAPYPAQPPQYDMDPVTRRLSPDEIPFRADPWDP